MLLSELLPPLVRVGEERSIALGNFLHRTGWISGERLDDQWIGQSGVVQAFAGDPPGSMKEVAERYGKLFADADKRWHELRDEHEKKSDGSEKAGAPTVLPDANQEALREVLYGELSPVNLPAGEIRRLFDVPTAQKLR